MRVQVDLDASPGVLCVSVRVAVSVAGWGEGSGEWAGGCTGCFRVTLVVSVTPVSSTVSTGTVSV